MSNNDTTAAPMFNKRERDRLASLRARLDHLEGDHPERTGDPAYPPGESMALKWVLDVVEGIEEPMEVKLERLHQGYRVMNAELGRLTARVEQLEEEMEEV